LNFWANAFYRAFQSCNCMRIQSTRQAYP
jgi:hypothetical protein